LLEHALGTSNKQESESNILQIDSIKPNSENHAFNKLYQQDVNPDSLEDDPDKTPTILVVEDDPISLQLTQKLLNNYKVKLDVAKTGRKAFAALTSQRYDLILLDINLPDTSGIYIVGQISSGYGINSDTPIIMLSGRKDKATVSQAIKNGAKGYIIKPLYKDVINKLFTKYNLPIAAKN
jgi:CheY-like chemotaxis protein